MSVAPAPRAAGAASRGRALVGSLVGTAVGDALGLPCEGMSARRGARLFPDRDRHHFLPGRGMVSDDTEHAFITARALLESGGDPDAFARRLARGLRWWALGLPAGIGLATLRACARLWAGVPPTRSGVPSAGNGAVMRAPILGVAAGDRPGALRELVRVSTRVTHTDPRAFHGAMASALAARWSASGEGAGAGGFAEALREALAGEDAEEMLGLVGRACRSAREGEPVAAFAQSIGSRAGVSGYVCHTVPCVLQAWLRYPRDFAGGVREIVAAGGDTDTTAAILGGIVGAAVGRDGIPAAWREGIAEWPRSLGWMERLGTTLARAVDGEGGLAPPRYFVPGVPLRNAFFTAAVLVHAFRRLAPPY